MNRVYNNEAIMMLCIVRLLQDGAMDMAKLLLCMVLAIDDRLNAKVRYAYSLEHVYAELHKEHLLNRKFVSYCPYYINALIMLRQLNCLGITGDMLYVTNNILGDGMGTHSRRMARIICASDNIRKLFGAISTSDMYNKLAIQL